MNTTTDQITKLARDTQARRWLGLAIRFRDDARAPADRRIHPEFRAGAKIAMRKCALNWRVRAAQAAAA
ncbi:MAG: hypothetical protein K0R17_2265 [Rariglobus sp.]|jgi:hypothetical protein|nr:hypothetical protein [Rariglobus sp.]